jgi:periplasmic protein TonB
MKRKNEKVPGFDEIIFENRNQQYGAYDLRKRYNSTTSISILGGVVFSAALIVAFSFSVEKGKASGDPAIVIIDMDNPILPDPVIPESKPPSGMPETMKNIAPEVTTDTTGILTLPPITDDILATTRNRDINDTVKFIEISEPVIPVEPEPYISVKEMPEFPGGITALMQYINENISYPEEAIKNNIQGRVVLKFVVRADGTVGKIEIAGGIDPLLNEEAIRVVKSLPTFKPGKQDGIPVPVWFIVPVLFRLENI